MIQDLEDQHRERIRNLRLHDVILGDAYTCQEQLQKLANEKNITVPYLLHNFHNTWDSLQVTL
jgi:hypothetical protein